MSTEIKFELLNRVLLFTWEEYSSLTEDQIDFLIKKISNAIKDFDIILIV